jgi:hypothetical protein
MIKSTFNYAFEMQKMYCVNAIHTIYASETCTLESVPASICSVCYLNYLGLRVQISRLSLRCLEIAAVEMISNLISRTIGTLTMLYTLTKI